MKLFFVFAIMQQALGLLASREDEKKWGTKKTRRKENPFSSCIRVDHFKSWFSDVMIFVVSVSRPPWWHFIAVLEDIRILGTLIKVAFPTKKESLKALLSHIHHVKIWNSPSSRLVRLLRCVRNWWFQPTILSCQCWNDSCWSSWNCCSHIHLNALPRPCGITWNSEDWEWYQIRNNKSH